MLKKATSASIRETVSRTKTNRKYYCMDIGHYYDYYVDMSKTIMQKTISFHQIGVIIYGKYGVRIFLETSRN